MSQIKAGGVFKKAFAFIGDVGGADPPDFDPTFYGTYYGDLRLFKTRSALLRHYRRHGKQEGRFPSLAAARSHFELVNGPPPADFDARMYQQLNPDLAKLYSDPIQYEMHFLEFGRFENRPYSGNTGRSEDAWRALLNVYDFNLLNESWLPRGGLERDAAIAQFEAEGIERLAPLARGWTFDPAFYRAQYAVAKPDDAAIYRDWLVAGFPAGRAPNELRAIFHLLGGKPYPACFDWERFAAVRRPHSLSPYPAKIEALELLFEAPLDDFSNACISGPDAGRLYEAIGDYHLIRARFREASDAYREVCASTSESARSQLRLGDALKALGDTNQALSAYRRALTLPDCPIWALIHAVNIMLAMKMFREAMRLVEDEKDRLGAHELFDGFLDEVAGAVYRSVADTMHSMIADDKQDGVLDTYADQRLGEITRFLRTMKMSGEPLNLAARGRPRVVVLACLDLAQCTFYRVEQKRRLLDELGIQVEVFNFADPTPFISALPGAAAAIFYRVPCYPKIVESILHARRLSIPTYFDIDDLVFTRDFPDTYESYEQQISRKEYFGLCHGVALYRHAIALCDGAIVSTQPLAERIAPMTAGGLDRTFVVPNGLDDRAETAMLYGKTMSSESETLSIFYGTGTKAHNADFSEIVAPALLEVLADHPRTRLVLVGYLRLDKRFHRFEDRITRFSFIDDLDTYWAILASCDINISVLHAGPIADCKSEIKWLEAAMLGIPSIVSATRTYEDVLDHGSTGLLAHDTEDWRRHFHALIENPEQRLEIGARARALALREYGPDAIAAKLESVLFRGAPAARGGQLAGGRRRKKILVCNVFFAPQSHGGATRVAEDNVDQLLERYADEFDISILSTFKGLKVGELRVDSHRGCPVYRIGTPLEVNMDWRPFNDADILPAFRRVLEVAAPDLVHFHCIQRLTASIVEETLLAAIPYVVTVHDAWWIADHQFLVDQDDRLVDFESPFETSLPSGVTRPDSLRRMQRLKSLLNAGVATLAVSRSFAQLYRRAGIANVEACENGIGALPPPRAKTTPSDRLVLGHIGSRSVHKGAALVEMVLKTNAFRNLSLIIVDGTFDVGEQQQDVWGATPVTIRAPIASGKIDELFSQIDVLLAPSLWPESYGLVAREALHYRSWVVASKLGAMAQDIVEGENGFVIDPSSSHDLAAVLGRLDDDVARYKEAPPVRELRRSSAQVDELVEVYRRASREASDQDVVRLPTRRDGTARATRRPLRAASTKEATRAS